MHAWLRMKTSVIHFGATENFCFQKNKRFWRPSAKSHSHHGGGVKGCTEGSFTRQWLGPESETESVHQKKERENASEAEGSSCRWHEGMRQQSHFATNTDCKFKGLYIYYYSEIRKAIKSMWSDGQISQDARTKWNKNKQKADIAPWGAPTTSTASEGISHAREALVDG